MSTPVKVRPVDIFKDETVMSKISEDIRPGITYYIIGSEFLDSLSRERLIQWIHRHLKSHASPYRFCVVPIRMKADCGLTYTWELEETETDDMFLAAEKEQWEEKKNANSNVR